MSTNKEREKMRKLGKDMNCQFRDDLRRQLKTRIRGPFWDKSKCGWSNRLSDPLWGIFGDRLLDQLYSLTRIPLRGDRLNGLR